MTENGDEEKVLCLNRTYSYMSRCVGYCHLHHCYVTKKQTIRRRCTAKNCRYLERTESYIAALEEKKQNKSERKNKMTARIDWLRKRSLDA